MTDADPSTTTPQFGLGTLVHHPSFGQGRITGYDADRYIVLFKGGEVRKVAFSYAGLEASSATPGDPETDRLKQAVGEVLGDYGWIETDLEMGKRWIGGTIVLQPGDEATQPKEIPLDAFFKKIIGVREKLRVLEQKINNHPSLNSLEKLDLQGYLTRCYGSLTTFNVLFASKESHLKGQSGTD